MHNLVLFRAKYKIDFAFSPSPPLQPPFELKQQLFTLIMRGQLSTPNLSLAIAGAGPSPLVTSLALHFFLCCSSTD